MVIINNIKYVLWLDYFYYCKCTAIAYLSNWTAFPTTACLFRYPWTFHGHWNETLEIILAISKLKQNKNSAKKKMKILLFNLNFEWKVKHGKCNWKRNASMHSLQIQSHSCRQSQIVEYRQKTRKEYIVWCHVTLKARLDILEARLG